MTTKTKTAKKVTIKLTPRTEDVHIFGPWIIERGMGQMCLSAEDARELFRRLCEEYANDSL